MPRTLDRYGNTLNSGVFSQQVAGKRFAGQWVVVLYDMDGQPTTSSAWIPYVVPGTAILQRQRRLGLDSGPMTLSLSLLAEALPTEPKTYWRIEIDRAIGFGTNHWPYFTGIIDKVSASFVREKGSIYRVLHLECFGVLQRAKDYPLAWAWWLPNRSTITIGDITMVAERVVVRRDHDTKNGDKELVPTAVGFALDDATYGLQIDDDAAFGSPYTGGGTHYTLDVTKIPAEITWAVEPADTRYYRFWRVALIGRPKIVDMTGGPTLFTTYRLPYGREPFDLFMTRVSSYTAGPPATISVKDPSAYRSGNNLLHQFGQNEYVIVTQVSTGEEVVKQLSSTDANGVLTLASGITFADGATPVEDDLVRVATTEMYTGWVGIGMDVAGGGTTFYPHSILAKSGTTLSADINSTATSASVGDGTLFRAGQYISMDNEIMRVNSVSGNTLTLASSGGNRAAQLGTTAAAHTAGVSIYGELKKGVTKILSDTGLAILSGGVHVSATQDFRSQITWLNEVTSNRTEQFLKNLLVDMTSLYASGDLNLTATGYFMKTFPMFRTTVDQVLADVKESGLPANAYLTDERDGDLTVKPYKQVVNPDGDLIGVSHIEEEAGPEPVGAVNVIAETHDENVAAQWFDRVSYNDASTPSLSNPERIIDGSADTFATQADPGIPGVVEFTIPTITPAKLYPWVDRIEIEGKGYFTVHLESPQSSPSKRWMVEGWHYRPIGLDGQGNSATLTREELGRALVFGTPADLRGTKIFVTVHGLDDSQVGSAAQVAEIRIWVKHRNAWKASLTNDSATDGDTGSTGAVPTGWVPSDTETFGTVWWQPNSLKRESYRFAPTSYLKRTAVVYSSTRATNKLREKDIILNLMNPQDARDYAERYADEFFRVVNTYRVTAPLDDRWERGDTLRVTAPAGKKFFDGSTSKNLLLWEISDGGSRSDNSAEYLFKEYA